MSAAGIYALLREPFELVAESAVDEQTDFADRLSLVEAIEGAKPSFVAFLDGRARHGAFSALGAAMPDGVPWGFVEAEVHHRYRPFRIADREMLEVVEARASYRQNVFWVARDTELAEAYRRGQPSSLPDDVLLGYPPCCAAWHYDVFFARGVEAFCSVAGCEARPGMLSHLRRDWEPRSGFYLPDTLFLAAILRSNASYPYIDHMACPACLSDRAGPSGVLNSRRSALGVRLDPALHARVAAWSARQEPRWRQLLDGRAGVIRARAGELCMSVRGAEEYSRHARHLVKAILG